MQMNYGHATPEEQVYVQQLETDVAHKLELSSINSILELGQLYIEPCHREAEAMKLFEAVLRREPSNSAAKFWLAYCNAWYLMEYSEAVPLLQEIIVEQADETAAAYVLLAYCKERLEQTTSEEQINLLQTSVELEPNWVNNHAALAWAYRKEGRLSEAIEQLKEAIENLVEVDSTWSLLHEIYEVQITGRASTGQFLRMELEKMTRQITIS